ncbi:MAG: dTDP-glucose pyrophosphorylase [Cyanobacteria bacterium Co-bin13]|nr:dTDP-glucose pyrophosphorylase [Cyanobacteria bacterium Co-bin13]
MPPTRIIGLMPAAGQATRLGPLPMSKELFPLGIQAGAGPRVACHSLLAAMRQGGITEALVILRPGKWDIPAYLGDGALLDMRLGYLTVHVPFGVPFSLNQAYPFVREATVALGFPDILFQPQEAYTKLLARQAAGGADVVLGLFPTDQPEKVGVVEFDEAGRVAAILEKSQRTDLKYMWAIAIWQPSFTEFLHQFIEAELKLLIGDTVPQTLKQFPPYSEIPIGDVIQAAIGAGLRVEAEAFAAGRYLDIGTPDNLKKAVSGDF